MHKSDIQNQRVCSERKLATNPFLIYSESLTFSSQAPLPAVELPHIPLVDNRNLFLFCRKLGAALL